MDAVVVPAVVVGQVVDLYDDAGVEAFEAWALVGAVLDFIDLRGEVVAGDDGEWLVVAAQGEPARGWGCDHVGGQMHDLVKEGV